MSLTNPDGTRPSLSLAPLPMRHALVRAERAALAALVERHDGDRAAAAAERADLLATHGPRLSKLPLLAALAAGVHHAGELADLAGAVRELPAA